ncbi:MAG: nucleoside hydrolase [Gammaproteobacteria bacterium]|nr:nucleoside hydrolase [Gammaproteobacteria bacterium]MDH3374785.1 nucleoside hydrolase [Gammaproteobacteria bacterium]MDH3408326.1 nucleoside hydrolase [Gammaproteobacteria bacterium]MDH3551391.1 nucleoside hydrolase [Gammaproteobacteria bacterium]
MTRKIIIDCDPGQDDAVALFLALASSEELDLLGITAVCGNVPLELTQRNARQMCDIAGRQDVPVYAGCEKPMLRPLRTAEMIHGETGINGIDVIDPETPLQSAHAVDFIIETLLDADDASIILVPTGPLTNIGTAIDREPGILPKIEQIVLMGGAMREGGNRTPSAEFNILVDPDAADNVFRCGRPIVQMGLDVTHQVLSTRDRVGRIAALGNPVADATAGMLSFFDRYDTKKYASKGAPLHDPCTIAWLIRPELFEGKDCNVSIETQSELTLGHTAVDFWHVTERPVNVHWVYSVDAGGFYDLLTERLARFGD